MGKNKTVTESDERRVRQRLRGYWGTKEGKTVGFASIAIPVMGFIINDLRKPDSIVRRLATTAAKRLLEYRQARSAAGDITDRVEVTMENGRSANGASDQQ